MNQFILRKDDSPELIHFEHIYEFECKKNTSISLNSFDEICSMCFRIYYIIDGKFDWVINGEHFTIFPNDLVMILPQQSLSAEKGYLEIGTLYCLKLDLNSNNLINKNISGYNALSVSEFDSIKKILLYNTTPVLTRLQDAGSIFSSLRNELLCHEIGYATRVYQILDELLILIARKLTRQNISHRDFPKAFLNLEQALRKDLSHHWTVDEMAALVGMGTTAFSDKVKNFTGFSPINYLINIRISEAIKLLKKPDEHVTDIALDIGFYSSQHFATTFKKLTGYTPSQFRKKNT